MTEVETIYDKNNRPIISGDLLKTFHYRVAHRRQKFYLYHIAVQKEGYMQAVPVHYLDPNTKDSGGRYWLTKENSGNSEIVYGYGPEAGMNFTDRKKVNTK